MAQKNPWVKVIKNGSRKQLARVEQFLFVNVSLTLTYLVALQTVGLQYNRLTSAQQAYYMRLVSQVRLLALSVDLQSLADVLIAICDPRRNLQTQINCNMIVLGVNHDDPTDRAEAILSRLLDALDLYRTVRERGADGANLLTALSFLITFPGQAQVGTNTWIYTIYNMQTTGDLRTMMRLADLMYGFGAETTVQIVPFSQWRPGHPIMDFRSLPLAWALPVDDSEQRWFVEKFQQIQATLLKESQLALEIVKAVMANSKPVEDEYEIMWLEMMCEPVHGLRPDGLDKVKIEHEALKEAGYVELHLYPGIEFPNFKARYIRRPKYGGEQAIEMLLEPSALKMICEYATEEAKAVVSPKAYWMDKVLAFIAVRVVNLIVMDRLSKSGGVGKVNGAGGGSAIVRPIFRRLPLGQRASEEARSRALAHFRTEPLPGFTFVRGYKRGENPNSGEPIFDLDEALAGLPVSSC